MSQKLTLLEDDNQFKGFDTAVEFVSECCLVKAVFAQVVGYFRKVWVQVRNPYRPERRYMRGSQARSGK